MKVYIYSYNGVVGPHDMEELLERYGGISPEALVCPEQEYSVAVPPWRKAELLEELTPCLKPEIAAPLPATPEEPEPLPASPVEREAVIMRELAELKAALERLAPGQKALAERVGRLEERVDGSAARFKKYTASITGALRLYALLIELSIVAVLAAVLLT